MQFFSYSVIMLFGTAIFIILAYQYKPNDGVEMSRASQLASRRNSSDIEFELDSEEIRTLAVDLAK